MDRHLATGRIHDPDQPRAGIEIVLHFFRHRRRAIIGRPDLDRQIGSQGDKARRHSARRQPGGGHEREIGAAHSVGTAMEDEAALHPHQAQLLGVDESGQPVAEPGGYLTVKATGRWERSAIALSANSGKRGYAFLVVSRRRLPRSGIF